MNFFVDKNYTGVTSNGSVNNPWKTLSQVYSNRNSINPGDTISLKKGSLFNETFTWLKSGTAQAPITFNSYGSGAKPKLRFTGDRTVMIKADYINIDGLNFNDPTFNVSDKVNPAYNGLGLSLGEYLGTTANRCRITNCDFSNIGGGITVVGDWNVFDKCVMSDMKNIQNTYGTPGSFAADNDYGANPFTMTGNNNTVMRCNISGAWAESQDYGWNGGAFEMFDGNNNNQFIRNVIWDCGGVAEFGAFVENVTAYDNLFAYNKIINCGNLSWINYSGQFTIDARRIKYYNNVIVENNLSRFSGPNTGAGAVTPAVVAKIVSEPDMLAFSSGSPADTIYDIQNNLFILETPSIGSAKLYRSSTVANKTIHKSNIFKLGANRTVGATLDASEAIVVTSPIVNMSNPDPLLWDYTPADASPLIDAGQSLGLTKDFVENDVANPVTIGIIQAEGGVVVPPLVRNGRMSVKYKTLTSCKNTATGSLTIQFTGTNSPWYMKVNNQPYLDANENVFTGLARGAYTVTCIDAGGFIYTLNTTIASKNPKNC